MFIFIVMTFLNVGFHIFLPISRLNISLVFVFPKEDSKAHKGKSFFHMLESVILLFISIFPTLGRDYSYNIINYQRYIPKESYTVRRGKD